LSTSATPRAFLTVQNHSRRSNVTLSRIPGFSKRTESKLLVVACNTASALALPAIRKAIKVPVIGVIEPGSRAAVEIAKGANIGVIATEATVQSHAYAKAIAAMGATGQVIERACPLFVALAEEGWADSDVARTVARDYLSEFTGKTLGALVLGCTHYPILREVISETVGRKVELIDSGAATARDVESLLDSSDLTHEDHSVFTRNANSVMI
jgi:glutamate racemase